MDNDDFYQMNRWLVAICGLLGCLWRKACFPRLWAADGLRFPVMTTHTLRKRIGYRLTASGGGNCCGAGLDGDFWMACPRCLDHRAGSHCWLVSCLWFQSGYSWTLYGASPGAWERCTTIAKGSWATKGVAGSGVPGRSRPVLAHGAVPGLRGTVATIPAAVIERDDCLTLRIAGECVHASVDSPVLPPSVSGHWPALKASRTRSAAVSRPRPLIRGEAVYQRFCFSCHAAGIAGAPKLGDAETWAARLTKGKDQLLHSTIEGMVPGMAGTRTMLRLHRRGAGGGH